MFLSVFICFNTVMGVSAVATSLSFSLTYCSVGMILAIDTPAWKHLLIVLRIGRISLRM